jgi:hypothetical protein
MTDEEKKQFEADIREAFGEDDIIRISVKEIAELTVAMINKDRREQKALVESTIRNRIKELNKKCREKSPTDGINERQLRHNCRMRVHEDSVMLGRLGISWDDESDGCSLEELIEKLPG